MRGTYDVVVAGGGPAGAIVAGRLAGAGVDTLLVGADADLPHRYQTLTTAAVRLLGSLGVDDLATCLAPSAASSWIQWADDEPSTVAVDRLITDRRRLDPALRAMAVWRGAEIVRGRVEGASEANAGGHWHVGLRTARGPIEVTAGALVAATGRGRSFGTERRLLTPPTLAIVATVPAGWLPADLCVAATPDGWVWGVASPEGGAIVACVDPAPQRAHTGLVSRMLRDARWPETGAPSTGGVAVVGSTTGGAWWSVGSPARLHLVGDAAVAFDPLSGQGLSAALRSGVQVADALAGGDLDAPTVRPVRSHESVAEEHLRTIASAYAAASCRFDTDFWRARSRLGVSSTSDRGQPVGRAAGFGTPPPGERTLLVGDLDGPA